MITRYEPSFTETHGLEMEESETGPYVLHADYEALQARVNRLIAALPNVHKMRAYARMFEDGEPMKRDLDTWANNAENALKEP